MSSNRRTLAIAMMVSMLSRGNPANLGIESRAAAIVNQGMLDHYKGLRQGRKPSGVARSKRIARKRKNIRARNAK